MNTSTLNKLSKDQLIELMLEKNAIINKLMKYVAKYKKEKKPTPAPRKNVKQMVQDYEDNIIDQKIEDEPIIDPRKSDDQIIKDEPILDPKNVKQMVQDYEDNIINPPSTIIKKVAKALKGYTESYEIGIKNYKDPLSQLQNTIKAIEYHISKILTSMKGLKFVEALKVTFKKMTNDQIVYKTAYFNSKPKTIINNAEILESLQSSKEQILNIIAQWISEGSGWTIESVDNHYLNIVKYEPMKGSSYIELPQELRNSLKGLINIKNQDNECFRWCHIRHLNPQKEHSERIKKSDKQYINELDYSGIEFPVTTKQYNKIEKQNNIRINVFGRSTHRIRSAKYPLCRLNLSWLAES